MTWFSARWPVEGPGDVWLVGGRGRGNTTRMDDVAEVLGPELSVTRLDAWFPEGWLSETGGAMLASVCGALDVLSPGQGSHDISWMKAQVREALRDGRLVAVRMILPPPPGAIGEEIEEERYEGPRVTHDIEFLFEYPDGTPVKGLAYVLTDPKGAASSGKLGDDGLISKQNVEPGTYTVAIKEVEQVKWEKVRAACGEAVKIHGRTSGFPAGTSACVKIFREFSEADDEAIETIDVSIQDDKVEVAWACDEEAQGEGYDLLKDACFVAELSVESGKFWAKTDRTLRVARKVIRQVRWARDVVQEGDEAQLVIEAPGFDKDTAAEVKVWRHSMRDEDTLVAEVDDAVLQGPRLQVALPVSSTDTGGPHLPGWGEYYAIVTVGDRTARSDLIVCQS